MTTEIKNAEDRKIRDKILSMILPITAESILEMAAGFVSMAMIGRIDAMAVSSLGIGNRILNILWALFKGIATGASVFVAQAYGARNYEKVKKISEQTIFSSMILVVILQQVVFWNASKFLKIFNPSDALLKNGTMFLKTASWGIPFLTIVLIVVGVLQGMGDAKTPMKLALIMNLFNVLFSYILIFGKFGFKPMGLKGAAIATALSQCIAAFIGLHILFGKNGTIKSMGVSVPFKPDKDEIGRIYKVGLPTSFESIFWQLAAIIITKAVLSYGENALAAYQLGLQAESISYMPAAGFGIAATTFIGQTLGAGDGELGKKYISHLVKDSFIITIFTSGILIFFPEKVMRILTDDKEIIEIGIEYLRIMGIAQISQNVSGVFNGALRGAGYTRVPMIVAGIGLWFVRVPISLLAAYYFKTDIIGIWIAIGIDMGLRLILSYGIYKSKDIYNNDLVTK